MDESITFLRSKEKSIPSYGILIGSGFSCVLQEMENTREIPYSRIPHFPQTSIEGQEGSIILGNLGGKKVVVLKGTPTYYELSSSQEVAYPVRVLKQWGITKLFICSSVGSLKSGILPGSIFVVDNHINFIPNPLIGPNSTELGARLPHGKDPYHLEGNQLAIEFAKKSDITAHRGVYVAVSGPSGSTRSELKAWAALGGDVVGSGVAPEVIACMQLKLRVQALCVVTDSLVPEESHEVPEEEILRVATENAPKVLSLLRELLRNEQGKAKSAKLSQQGEGLVLHGNRYYHKQNYTKALEFYKQALEKENYEPAIWNIHNRLSATYSRLKDYQSALEQADMMIKLKPDHAKGYLRKGGAFFFLGKYDLALQAYLKAKQLNEAGSGEDLTADNLEKYIAETKGHLAN
eukprot:TRINITY_DN4117_c0_g1_i1.p1 TRINITY_DN4117_c0_g1~~TRINITY_DN4117_c0_g1_i1.p1  ORF type:complete len:477 (-),score=111.06 TRINITY_DN4117_c0_g1_i1:112-1329(-)